MKVGLLVEAQNGLTWERWSHVLTTAEGLGFHSVMRTDHFFQDEQRDSMEAYISFIVAAKETREVRFGPLVTPVMFRSPVDVGRMAAQIDVLSGGRFVLGLGIGGGGAEYRAYGIPFPPVAERFDRLEEAISVIRALWSPGPSSYRGRYYRLEGVDCLPKPAAADPPIVIGGTGERRTLPLAARCATEWNCDGFMPPRRYARKGAVADRACETAGRDPATLRRSMLIFGYIIGPTTAALERATLRAMEDAGVSSRSSTDRFRAEARERGALVGTTPEVLDALGALAELRVEEVQFDHVDFDSDEMPEYLASDVVPRAERF